MDRRKFLESLWGVAGMTLVGGIYCGNKLYARNQLENALISSADSILTAKGLHELRTLPNQAKEGIRVWFQKPCMNAEEFAVSVSSERFLNRLAQTKSEQQRQEMFLFEFLSKVVSEEQILHHTEMMAEEIGNELDFNWEECCRELSSSWQLNISQYGESLPVGLSEQLRPAIRHQIEGSLSFSATAAERPTLLQTAKEIGESALLLLPMAPVSKRFIPLFMFAAATSLYEYFVGMLSHSRDRILRGVSSRMTSLAHRVGTEFEAEINTAIARLHNWQQNAVHQAAAQYAESNISVVNLPSWS